MVNTKKNTSEKNIRAPIVTIMGHVDHGKTSILDAIRKTNLTEKEYGGITQHIGAYQITHKNKKITFIDTPGHAAFTQMRARGGKAADIVVLVVAADEGVKPQTKEAISHIKAAQAPIIVAINKIDKPGADSRKVKQELSLESVLVEDWGGNELSVELSAKTGEGVDTLLDAIIALSEMLSLKGDPNGDLEAVVIESRLDRKKGVVVSCIVRNGTLRLGDRVSASGCEAKVKSLSDDEGNLVKQAGPSDPVEILGFSKVPHVGDLILAKGSELAELAIDEDKVEIIGKDAKRTISVVLKADTQGTLEAVKGSLADLVTSSAETTYALKFLHTGTGDMNESDVMLAQGGKGVVIGFDVRIPAAVEDLAESSGVLVRSYRTIYELIDDVEKLIEGTATTETSKIKGRAKVVKLFKLKSGDIVIGCKVLAGALKVKSRVAIYDKNPADLTKEDEPLFYAAVKKLKKGKDDTDVVGKDNECGVLLKPQYNEIAEEMYLEVL
ncbi:translation initiation factor IF-2 [Patescibacteria group bacterium]|nr:translation initiation factor IF-2 [Patescibacteria group bacterium]MBU1953113.1 translation initiation factor IF-2 [Patescibacteria group bacterium]